MYKNGVRWRCAGPPGPTTLPPWAGWPGTPTCRAAAPERGQLTPSGLQQIIALSRKFIGLFSVGDPDPDPHVFGSLDPDPEPLFRGNLLTWRVVSGPPSRRVEDTSGPCSGLPSSPSCLVRLSRRAFHIDLCKLHSSCWFFLFFSHGYHFSFSIFLHCPLPLPGHFSCGSSKVFSVCSWTPRRFGKSSHPLATC